MYVRALQNDSINVKQATQFFHEMLQDPKTWFISGVNYWPSALSQLSTLPKEEAREVIVLTRLQVKREATLYEESLGTEWMQFFTEKALDNNLALMESLLEAVDEGRMSQDQLRARITQLEEEATCHP
jgi:hypothetical protein